MTNLSEWTLLVNTELMEIDEKTGKIREDQNEIVIEDITLSLTKNVTGGKNRYI